MSMRRGLIAVMLAGSLAACADDRGFIGPPASVPFSPGDVAVSIFSLRFAADNIAVVQVGTITDALGLTTPGFSATPRRYERGIAPRGSIAPSFRPDGLKRIVANRAARLARGAKSVPLFPINFLGRTFIFDAGIDGYVVDDALGGAPEDGVRFVLYRLDPVSRLPALPLAPFGFVDLIDQSDAVSTRLRVIAFDTTGGELPLANYLIDGAFGSLSSGIIVNLLTDGFIVDHNGRFDFNLDETLETDDPADVTLISLDHRVISDEGTSTRLRVEGDIANDGSHSDLGFLFNISGAAGATDVDLRIVDGLQDGTIRHGGQTEVFVSGTVALPNYQTARGGGVSPNDIAALDEILFGIDDVLIMADELFRPLGELFGVR